VIVVETSALIAILLRERGGRLFKERIAEEEDARLPVSCYVEASLVWRRKRKPPEAVEDFLTTMNVQLLPFDERQARLAVQADRRFGRCTGHPARLNFGDCFSYAAAVAHDAPLLFKGDDFVHTDVLRAV
jgi:ribonuclease VapC